MFLQTWDLGPDVKKRVFPNENWIVEPWTCNKNTLDHFYVHYNNKFCQFFLNKQTDFHFLLGSYLTVWIQVAKHKAANRTLSTDFFFSWNGTLCPRSVFTQVWITRESCFLWSWELGWPDGKTTNWYQTRKGIHQGCILSPYSFNFYAEHIMRNAGLDEAQAGIKISGENISNLRYSHDTTLMAEREE